jgi:hypothetical protein
MFTITAAVFAAMPFAPLPAPIASMTITSVARIIDFRIAQLMFMHNIIVDDYRRGNGGRPHDDIARARGAVGIRGPSEGADRGYGCHESDCVYRSEMFER